MGEWGKAWTASKYTPALLCLAWKSMTRFVVQRNTLSTYRPLFKCLYLCAQVSACMGNLEYIFCAYIRKQALLVPLFSILLVQFG